MTVGMATLVLTVLMIVALVWIAWITTDFVRNVKPTLGHSSPSSQPIPMEMTIWELQYLTKNDNLDKFFDFTRNMNTEEYAEKIQKRRL